MALDFGTKQCDICKQVLPVDKFHLNGGKNPTRRSTCHKCCGDRYRAQVKLQVFGAFGYKCACCGENNPYFLTLDHKIPHENGHPYRNGLNKEQIYTECIKDEFDPEKYQLLCMNCNFAKGIFGACPHATGISPAKALLEIFIKAGIDVNLVNVISED